MIILTYFNHLIFLGIIGLIDVKYVPSAKIEIAFFILLLLSVVIFTVLLLVSLWENVIT